VQQLGCLQVEALAEDVEPQDLDVLAALALGQLRVEVSGLGVDQVGRERAGVAPEQSIFPDMTRMAEAKCDVRQALS
jgi:hypothetical protein